MKISINGPQPYYARTRARVTYETRRPRPRSLTWIEFDSLPATRFRHVPPGPGRHVFEFAASTRFGRRGPSGVFGVVFLPRAPDVAGFLCATAHVQPENERFAGRTIGRFYTNVKPKKRSRIKRRIPRRLDEPASRSPYAKLSVRRKRPYPYNGPTRRDRLY